MRKINFQFQQPLKLRYGENPHQKGWVWQKKTSDPLAFFKLKQIQGKELSFNNKLSSSWEFGKKNFRRNKNS